MGLKQWYSIEKMKKPHIGDTPQSYSQIKITLLGHSTPDGAKFLMLGHDPSQNVTKIC